MQSLKMTLKGAIVKNDMTDHFPDSLSLKRGTRSNEKQPEVTSSND